MVDRIIGILYYFTRTLVYELIIRLLIIAKITMRKTGGFHDGTCVRSSIV